MREPETPGAFSDSMACRPASSSATTEDMMTGPRNLSSVNTALYAAELASNRSKASLYALLATRPFNTGYDGK